MATVEGIPKGAARGYALGVFVVGCCGNPIVSVHSSKCGVCTNKQNSSTVGAVDRNLSIPSKEKSTTTLNSLDAKNWLTSSCIAMRLWFTHACSSGVELEAIQAVPPQYCKDSLPLSSDNVVMKDQDFSHLLPFKLFISPEIHLCCPF